MSLYKKGLEIESRAKKLKIILNDNEMKKFKEDVSKEEKKEVVEEDKKEDSKKELNVGDIKKYKTDIDKILRLVETSKNVEMEEIPHILDIPIDRVESLAKVLERHDLLDICYPTVGPVELRIKKFSKKKRKKIGEVTDKKEVVKEKQEKKNWKKMLKFKFPSRKIISRVGIVLIILAIVIGSIFLIKMGINNLPSDFEEEVSSSEGDIVVGTAESYFVEEVVTLDMAFSGSGSYYCDVIKSGINTEYWIVDEDEKLITHLDTEDLTVIIKDNSIYTLITTVGSWLESPVTEDTSRPGVKAPELDSADCVTADIDATLFDIEEENIE
jgi:hypothetical protein